MMGGGGPVRAEQRQPPGGTSTTAAAGSLTLASAVVLGAGVSQQRRPNARCAAAGEASEASRDADVAVAHARTLTLSGMAASVHGGHRRAIPVYRRDAHAKSTSRKPFFGLPVEVKIPLNELIPPKQPTPSDGT